MGNEACKKQRRISVREKLRGELNVGQKVAGMVERHDDHDQAAQNID